MGLVQRSGLTLAITPTIGFADGRSQSNAIEAASAALLTVSLLTLKHERRTWQFAVAAAAGTLLATTRTLGPLFLVIIHRNRLSGRIAARPDQHRANMITRK